MGSAVPVPFDTQALRAWGELHGQPPLDQTELQKLWNTLIEDILAAAVWIDEQQGVDEWRGVYPDFCINPDLCRGRSSCPRERSCVD